VPERTPPFDCFFNDVVERGLTGGAREHEGQPCEHEHDVRAQEVRIGVPAVGQKQQQVQEQPHRGRRAREQSAQHEQANRDLDQRNADAGQSRRGKRQQPQDEASRCAVRELM
jgi:hypothetical protein